MILNDLVILKSLTFDGRLCCFTKLPFLTSRSFFENLEHEITCVFFLMRNISF